MRKVAILYHASCPDGFGAAWAAWRIFGRRAEYIPVRHQASPPKGLENKDVYLFDFAYPVKTMRELAAYTHHLVVLDHHLSAEAATKSAPEYWYNLNHSGAVLAWQYFFPKKPIPRLLRHIEDIDLWRFKLPGTRAIAAALELFNLTFPVWDKIARDLENQKIRKSYIAKGDIILSYEDRLIRSIGERAYKGTIGGKKCLFVNSPLLESEVGHMLVKKRRTPIALVWHYDGGGVKCSLRSQGTTDVSKLAEKFGGGGQKHAAGFYIKRKLRLPS